MKHALGVVIAAAMVCGLPGMASAHMRDYILNQSYYTTKRGEFEVELYNDYNMPTADDNGTYNSKHQVEVEYGITDRLQLAYYEVYAWDRTQDWERDEFKIEGKYRLFEAGQLPVDIALYTEYKNPDGPSEVNSNEWENKLILSRDFGPWNVVGNVVFEKAFAAHADWEFEYTAGASYAIRPTVRLGLELKESMGDAHDFGFRPKRNLQLMPTIAANITPHVRVLAGPAFGLTNASDDVQFRSIVEVEF
jgi:hypothetical protein